MSETWLTCEVLNEHITLPNFNEYRLDKGRGGGVCMYVSDSLSVTRIDVNMESVEGVEDL